MEIEVFILIMHANILEYPVQVVHWHHPWTVLQLDFEISMKVILCHRRHLVHPPGKLHYKICIIYSIKKATFHRQVTFSLDYPEVRPVVQRLRRKVKDQHLLRQLEEDFYRVLC